MDGTLVGNRMGLLEAEIREHGLIRKMIWFREFDPSAAFRYNK